MKPCACVTCRARYDYADMKECLDCGDAHLCPNCGEGSYHAVVFLDEPVVVIAPDAWMVAASVRASVWGRPN